jgi:hypothetical protein
MKFNSCVGNGESPMDGCFRIVPVAFPVADFGTDHCGSVEAAIQALAFQDRQFRFGQV